MNNQHPKHETLKEFALGTLLGDELEQVGQHVSRCDTCSAWLSEQSFHDQFLERLQRLDVTAAATFESDSETGLSFEDLQQVFAENSKYRLIREIGRGGMGAVYLAEHSIMGREVAIKIIREDYLSEDDAVSRFHQEVQSAARLSHKNIVTAHDADHVNDIHFLVMEYVEGESLAHTIQRKGRLSLFRSCNYIVQAAMGLRHANESGMVHRDIKPHNLMKTGKGKVKVLDFGLARLTGSENRNANLTSTGVLMGTASFMAPEQARDARQADIRSDLYSLGCTFYYLLSGKVPFEESNYVDQVIAHCTRDFPNIQRERDDIPDEVAEIIARLTAKDPDDRIQTPQELIQLLTPFARVTPSAKATVETQQVASPKTNVVPGLNKQKSHVQEATASEILTDKQGPVSDRRLLFLAIALLGIAAIGASIWGLFNSNGNNGRQGDLERGRPKVLAVISSSLFWYSDFGPLQSVMESNDIELLIASDEVGLASHNRKDAFQGARDIDVTMAMRDLDPETIASDVDAIVFMGTSVDEFFADNPTGEATRAIIAAMQDRKKWIGLMGKGINVPMYFGMLDNVEITTTSWIQDNARGRSDCEFVEAQVHVDSGNRVISCSTWHVATNFSERLAELISR